MSKSTTTYWNPLAPDQRSRWTPIKGLEEMAEEITLSIDQITGEYTRLTRFLPGADTSAFGERFMHTLRRYLLSVGGCTTKPSIAGLKQETTQAALRENVMVRLRPMSGVWCWRCHSPTGWRAERVADEEGERGAVRNALVPHSEITLSP
jgi:hypothetical protein